MALSRSQTEIKAAIVDHGRQRGFSPPTIQIAADIAYIESAFGASPRSADAGSSASGLFQYTDEAWYAHHQAAGEKDAPGNQIAAFYTDLATYVAWYHSPAAIAISPTTCRWGNSFSSCTTAGGAGRSCSRTPRAISTASMSPTTPGC